MSLTDDQLALAGVGVAHHFGGGAYIKETAIPAGTSLAQHAHDHDHLSYLVSGAVVVVVDGEARAVAAPAALKIEAGKVHEVHAKSDAIWLCVWSTKSVDPATVDQALERGE